MSSWCHFTSQVVVLISDITPLIVPNFANGSLVKFVVHTLSGIAGVPSSSELIAALNGLKQLMLAQVRAVAVDAALQVCTTENVRRLTSCVAPNNLRLASQAIAISADITPNSITQAKLEVDQGGLDLPPSLTSTSSITPTASSSMTSTSSMTSSSSTGATEEVTPQLTAKAALTIALVVGIIGGALVVSAVIAIVLCVRGGAGHSCHGCSRL